MATTDMQGCIDRFLASLIVNGKSENTVRAYKADLAGLTEKAIKMGTTSTDQETLELVAAMHLNDQRQFAKATTVRRKLACFRKFAESLGYFTFLDGYKAPTPSSGVPHPLPEGIPGILAMIEEARKPVHKAYITLSGLCGLRSSEARQVRPSHINTDLMVIQVHGKGDKYREAQLSDVALEKLLPRLVQCWPTDELLVPLHDRAARRAFTAIGQRALGRHTASHDGRMTFGTAVYYNSGGDIRVTQESLGHASLSQTEKYTGVTQAKLREAVDFVDAEDR